MNLLHDDLFRVVTTREERVSLPVLLQELGRKSVQRYTGLQRHQADAFHVFLCCLAAAVLARRNDTNPVQDKDYWLSGLRDLAGSSADGAWDLTSDTASMPAFMQPPIPENDYRPTAEMSTPDKLDLLQTAKNHDLKSARGENVAYDEWIYALISLQTMSGFMGKGNQGISRMNSGFGNRPIAELLRDWTPGGRWLDAVKRLQKHRNEILQSPFGFNPKGLVLVWLEPWDGSTSLPLSVLDPCYIEVCRRIRLLKQPSGKLSAHSIPCSVPRIEAKQMQGVVGDAWLPIEVTDSAQDSPAGGKALTIPTQGITAETMRRLVFPNQGLRRTALQEPLPEWSGDLWMTMSVMVRGQGTTDGFYEQSVRIPEKKRPRLFHRSETPDRLSALSKAGVDYAGSMQSQVLRHSVYTYLQGGPERVKWDRDSTKAWWPRYARRFELLWAKEFFPWLWSAPEETEERKVLTDWVLLLRDLALRVLREVQAEMPIHSGRQYRAAVRAEQRFWSSLYNNDSFSFLKGVRT